MSKIREIDVTPKKRRVIKSHRISLTSFIPVALPCFREVANLSVLLPKTNGSAFPSPVDVSGVGRWRERERRNVTFPICRKRVSFGVRSVRCDIHQEGGMGVLWRTTCWHKPNSLLFSFSLSFAFLGWHQPNKQTNKIFFSEIYAVRTFFTKTYDKLFLDVFGEGTNPPLYYTEQ